MLHIIDPEPDSRHAARTLLESVHSSVAEFASGDEFLAGLSPESCGGAVIDFDLPGSMNGLDVLRHVCDRRLPL